MWPVDEPACDGREEEEDGEGDGRRDLSGELEAVALSRAAVAVAKALGIEEADDV